MDPIVLVFYAAICGFLSWVAPSFSHPALRFGLGALVGVLAAFLLPILRATFGV